MSLTRFLCFFWSGEHRKRVGHDVLGDREGRGGRELEAKLMCATDPELELKPVVALTP